MLYALTVICVQVFLDLPCFFVTLLIDRDTDHSTRRGHGFGFHTGDLSLDIKITNLAEIEEALIEPRPFSHASAMNIVGQMVNIGQAAAQRIELRVR